MMCKVLSEGWRSGARFNSQGSSVSEPVFAPTRGLQRNCRAEGGWKARWIYPAPCQQKESQNFTEHSV